MNEIKNVTKKINNINNTDNSNIPKLNLELESQWFNESEGDLNLEDGINCTKCKNKGKISIIENGYEKIIDCECMKARKTHTRLINCGISKTILENYSFKKWKIKELWQKALLEKCRNFFIDYLNKKNFWFIISGQSGAGKTHICTALFQEMISSLYLNGEYLLWNDEIPKLLSLRKSSYSENQNKYEKIIASYKNTDILYIDDLFKLDNRYKEDSLSILFEILNHRYINDKITLISTEVEQDQFENIDTAIWGRCIEKTDRGNYWITLTGKEKNYRIKKETEKDDI